MALHFIPLAVAFLAQSFSTTLQADEELMSMVSEEITDIFLARSNDKNYNWNRFSKNKRVGDLYDNYNKPNEITGYYNKIFIRSLDRQLADELVNDHEISARILELEPCGVRFNSLGFGFRPIEGTPLTDSKAIAMVDRARIVTAYNALDTTIELSLATVEGLRYNDSSNDAIKSLNQRLLGEFQSGKYSEIYQIIDLSEGCGAGEVHISIANYDDFLSLHYIPEFFFRVCSERFANPWDTNLCIFWDEAQWSLAVSGVYRWQGIDLSDQFISGRFSVRNTQEQQDIHLR